ncbi:MAG TPA: ABC transporter permease [Pyrinomonadaceae bacterium]|nr:ABC transporter permease [Pyrinomonadaceae bacterium]
MNRILHDLRGGYRLMLKSPGFSLVAILSLALGIGANTAIFSVVSAVLFRPLPVKDPQQLVSLYSGFGSNRTTYGPFSYVDYVDFAEKTDVFSGLVAHFQDSMILGESDQGLQVQSAIVTGNYFSVLGVEAVRGRTFTAEEGRVKGANPVAVVSYSLWQKRFNGDPNLPGTTVKLKGHPFTVIGVVPERFTGTDLGRAPDIWVPMSMYAQVGLSDTMMNERQNHWLSVIGRLKPGVTVEQAQARVDVLGKQLTQEYPTEWTKGKEERTVTVLSQSTAWYPPEVQSAIVGVSGLLMGIVGLVLVIACTNLANLMLARASSRRKEMSIRMALGARRGRVIQQLLTESVLLSLVGGVVGVLIVSLSENLLAALKPAVASQVTLDVGFDARVFIFTLLISVLTGVLCGLAPALQATKVDLVRDLKNESAFLGRGYRRYSVRNLLIVAQVSVSLVLLVGAGLFVRSLRNAQSIDPGFEMDHLLTMKLDTTVVGLEADKALAFYQSVMDQTRNVSGVRSVTMASSGPLEVVSGLRPVYVEGYSASAGEDMNYSFNIVAPDYFQTMGIPLVQGREFTEADTSKAPNVVIINETMARTFWPNESPIGKRISDNGQPGPYRVVVGVARESKYLTLGEAPRPYYYIPLQQDFFPSARLHVRTVGDPQSMVNTVRAIVRGADATVPISNVQTGGEHLGLALLVPRIGAMLLGPAGLVALVLGIIGLYGVMSYSVARRTKEIGIRMALGAQEVDVLRMVMKEGMGLVGIGLLLGLTVAFVITRVLTSFLYGISATDPLTFVAVSLILIAVALVSIFIPARKALKVQPNIALRYD